MAWLLVRLVVISGFLGFAVAGCDAAKHVGIKASAGNQQSPNVGLKSDKISPAPGSAECLPPRPSDYRDYARPSVANQLSAGRKSSNSPHQSDDPSQSDDYQVDDKDKGDDEDPQDPKIPCVDRPADHQVVINQISYFGKACLPGTVNVTTSADLQAFTLVFNEFIAEAGRTSAPSDAKTDCAISVEVEQTGDWSFALGSADFRGFVELEDEVTASLSSKYRFPGYSNDSVTFVEDFIGELSENFTSSAIVSNAELVWSPCGSTLLRIETTAMIDNATVPDNMGLLAIDSLDGELVQSFGLLWKKCAS